MEEELRELLKKYKARRDEWRGADGLKSILISALAMEIYDSCIADLTALLEEYGMNDLEDK